MGETLIEATAAIRELRQVQLESTSTLRELRQVQLEQGRSIVDHEARVRVLERTAPQIGRP